MQDVHTQQAQLHRDSVILVLEQQNLELDTQLFKIKSEQYKNNKISLGQYIHAQQYINTRSKNYKANKTSSD